MSVILLLVLFFREDELKSKRVKVSVYAMLYHAHVPLILINRLPG